MKKSYILALDQGTTSSRCILFNKNGEICHTEQIETTMLYPKAGYVEQDAMEILHNQRKTMEDCVSHSGIDPKSIAAIGITNQRESIVVWDKTTGKPLYNAIIWQCKRSAEFCNQLKNDKKQAEMIQKKTGLIVNAYFSASKIRWLLNEVAGLREKAEAGEVLVGTIDSWLLWNLTSQQTHATDYTNASRTMLFDIKKLCWDEELLELFSVPPAMLPEVKPSSGLFGHLKKDIFGLEIPIAGVAGDQQAALFGQQCFEVGMVKNTYGTGCFLLMHLGKELKYSKNGLLTTLAASVDGEVEYAFEGSVFMAGAVMKWLRDDVRLIQTVKESAILAESVVDSGGVYLVPAFAGLGAPYWNDDARGALVNMSMGTSKAQIVRAALEAIAYQVYDMVGVMEEDGGVCLKSLRVDGGACVNDFLMQFQSDILNAEIVRPRIIETTALGAAFLAGLATGFWENIEEIKGCCLSEKVFSPTFDDVKRSKLLCGWKKAVAQVL